MLAGEARRFGCRDGQHVLDALEPVQGDRIIAGCHGGGCGVCRIRVIAGSYAAKAMNEVHISPGDRERGIVLACRTFPSSDLEIEVLGRREFAPSPKFKRRDIPAGLPPDRCS